MALIVPVVEGPGDVAALPILLRLILDYLQEYEIGVATPKNAHGSGNLLRPSGLEKFVEYAWRTTGAGGVLVVMDTESPGMCPKTAAPALASRLREVGAPRSISIVLAKTEYEVWLISSIESIAGKTLKGSASIDPATTAPVDCESIVNPKAWIERHFERQSTYKETLHQAAMSAYVNPVLAEQRSRSFRRLVNAIRQLVQGIRANSRVITPE